MKAAIRHLIWLCVFTLVAPGICVEARLTAASDDSDDSRNRWVDSVYNSLSLRQRVAQLVFPNVAPDQGQASKAAIKRFVATNCVGGLLFSKGSLSDYVDMINYARSVSTVPLIITFDGEWGPAMRIAEAEPFPKNMALGAITDPRLLYDYGLETARQCKAIGVNVNYAPVLDVNSNPSNPVIGMRSYGENPEWVGRLGVAYSLGLEDGGVMAVAKHFPGHGDTSTDSHKAVTTVHHDMQRLDSVDLPPFKGFIDAGCSGVMTGHIVLPAVDTSLRPASLSPLVTTTLLRDHLGFKGLIFTDALAMKGVKVEGANNAVLALKAGADVLETSAHPIADIDAIVTAVRRGDIPARRIEESCKRLLAYKYDLELAAPQPAITLRSAKAALSAAESEAVNRRLTAASMTVVRNRGDILPLKNLERASIAVVNIGAPADNIFSSYCSRYASTECFSLGSTAVTQQQLDKILDHDIVIAAVYSDARWACNDMERLKSASALIPVFFVNPYKVTKFASALAAAPAILFAYENRPLTQEYAAQAIFGGIEVAGRLPVDLPGVARLGSGVGLKKTRLGYSSPVLKGFAPELTDSLDALVGKLIADGGMPGCQLLVAKGGDIVYDKCFGRTTAAGPAVTHSTVYDLASVSKAAGTLPGLMKAYDMGLYAFDDFMSDYIPELKQEGKDSLRIREFLFHETGFPASLNMYDIMIDPQSYTGRLISPRRDKNHTLKIGRRAYGNNTARLRRDITLDVSSRDFPVEASKGLFVGQSTLDTIMNRIYNIPLRDSKRYNYSCLNFSLLMDLEQRLTGVGHDRFVADSIFAPLGAYTACYRPAEVHAMSDIAPTEKDNFLRRQHVHGYVHDELAAFSGGVQGNAGLFSNADDIAKYCQMLLNGGTYGGRRFLSQRTVDIFTRTKSPNSRRGLGFDKPDVDNPDASPTCEEADPSVIGHLGFTGTVFWIDPANDMIFVFLSNRVNPTRDSPVFNRSNIRPQLFRQLYKSIR